MKPRIACLLLLSPIFVSAQFDNFGGGEPRFCPPYKCAKKDHQPVPKWPLKFTSTGCSGMGGMQMMAPGQDDDSNGPQAVCCDRKHACYQTCGSLKTFCDEEFQNCVQKVCEVMDDPDAKEKCTQSGNILQLMVKMDNNCQKFDQDQYTHCECVPKNRVGDKRERVLRNFYKKHQPESVSKVPGLAKKADTQSKFVGLLLKLVKKYPQCVQKIKDPQQGKQIFFWDWIPSHKNKYHVFLF